MGFAQQVAWFLTLKEAADFQMKMYAQALVEGQKCDQWADIITDKTLGFGVPVKDRVKPAASAEEVAKIVDWTPPDVVKV